MSIVNRKPFKRKYIVALVLSSLYFLFHLHYMQQFMDWDQAAYLNNILNSYKPGWYPTYNAHHIHFETGGRLFHEMIMSNFRGDEYTDITFDVRLRSLLMACVGIFFTVLFLNNKTGKLLWGVIGAVLVGLCHGYLLYSTKVDTAIFPTAGLIVTLWIFDKLANTDKYLVALSVVTGIVLAMDVVFHQFMVFVCVSLAVTLILPLFLFNKNYKFSSFRIFRNVTIPKIEQKARYRYLSVFLITITTATLVFGVYFKAAFSEYNLRIDKNAVNNARGRFRYFTFQKWLFLYETTPYWGHGFENFNPKAPFRGFTDSFVSQSNKQRSQHNYYTKFNYNLEKPLSENHIAHNSFAVFTVFSLFGSLLFLPLMLRRYGRILVLFFLCIIIFSIFNTYWEGYNLEFWLMPCVLFCFLGVFILNLAGEKLKFLFRNIAQFPGYLVVLAFIFILFSHNLEYYLYPYTVYRKLETVNPDWEHEYYMKLFSTVIYKNPDNPYKEIYGIKEMPEIRLPEKKDEVEEMTENDNIEIYSTYH